ncbi:MAG: NAD-dependent epimerase/dehydratase family protein [Actinomycetota bacterium]|nr:NAD-dependent epimerase/dehydratase family protein [Actinomycetota bacterium]
MAQRDNGRLTVAVTGPTGSIGRALLRALDSEPAIERVTGMARRPFDPNSFGLQKTEYVQGDVTDRSAVNDFVKGADVVVHLAFVIFGSSEESRTINLQGCRNVFEAAFESGCERLIYTSSVAAYGFHEDNPEPLDESVPARGSDEHYYSAQKAEVEELLANLEKTIGKDTDVYVFRPCIVAGPTALDLIERIPYVQLSEKLPAPVKKLVGTIPLLRPVIPDPGIPLQLVHEDDVASALTATVLGRGAPGAYNLAADGEIGLSDLAHALGWYSIPIPDLAIDATARIVSRLPMLPAEANWLQAVRVPVVMDTSKARRELRWNPRHDALETLAQTVAAARARGLLPWRTATGDI